MPAAQRPYPPALQGSPKASSILSNSPPLPPSAALPLIKQWQPRQSHAGSLSSS